MIGLARGPYASRRPLWRRRLALVLAYQAPVLGAVGLALCAPLAIAGWKAGGLPPGRIMAGFLLPALAALGLGRLLQVRGLRPAALAPTEALLVTTAAWLVAALFGALPFRLVLGTPMVDALFESLSGFTTTGTTMLTGLDGLPASILLWRALSQWLGGLGILWIILLVGRSTGSHAAALLSAEGVKVPSGRLALNFRRAVIRFTQLYLVLSLACGLAYRLAGMGGFDALVHAMTTVATAGFSNHDASLAYFAMHPERYPLHAAIEWLAIGFMLAGGINFYVHYRLARGDWRALWDGLEMRLLWLVLGLGTALVLFALWAAGSGGGGPAADLRTAAFAVVSLVSTTGFELAPTGSFPSLAREVFLILMLIGGGAGSTAGGLKLIRVGLVGKFLAHEVHALRLPAHAVQVPTLDGQRIEDHTFRQAAFIVLLWLGYIALVGPFLTWAAPGLSIGEAVSIAASSIGVFGPSFATVGEVIALPDPAKLALMLGMLAGRLEILPLLVFFNPTAWRR